MFPSSNLVSLLSSLPSRLRYCLFPSLIISFLPFLYLNCFLSVLLFHIEFTYLYKAVVLIFFVNICILARFQPYNVSCRYLYISLFTCLNLQYCSFIICNLNFGRVSHLFCLVSVILFHSLSHFLSLDLPMFLVCSLLLAFFQNLTLTFLSVILFHFIAQLVRPSNIACFLPYFLFASTFSHLLCFLSVILLHSLAHFLPNRSICCYLFNWNASLHFSSWICFLSVILYYFSILFHRVSNIACFLNTACILAIIQTYTLSFQ